MKWSLVRCTVGCILNRRVLGAPCLWGRALLFTIRADCGRGSRNLFREFESAASIFAAGLRCKQSMAEALLSQTCRPGGCFGQPVPAVPRHSHDCLPLLWPSASGTRSGDLCVSIGSSGYAHIFGRTLRWCSSACRSWPAWFYLPCCWFEVRLKPMSAF